MEENKYYIVRGQYSGVFAGFISKRNGREVTLNNVRRLWYWEGAQTISQLASSGTMKADECKFSVPIQEMTVLDAVEIDACTEIARISIQGVYEWKI